MNSSGVFRRSTAIITESFVGDHRFISRYQFSKQFPKLEDIPEIVNPTIKGFLEVMRGCGIGCDFCEVTLRPLRYYPPEKVRREIEVNVKKGGIDNVWTHSDEIFAYKHGKNFVPDYDALVDLFSVIMGTPGVRHTNPTHGRISIPLGYPELIKKLSEIMTAGPENWIGLQVGVETGSDRLANPYAQQDSATQDRTRRSLAGDCLEGHVCHEQVLLASGLHGSGWAGV